MIQIYKMTQKMWMMLQNAGKLKGDLDMDPELKKELLLLQQQSWLVCPYSGTNLLVKPMGSYYYVIDDILVSPRKNTIFVDVAAEIGENCAKWGRIHIRQVEDVGGSIRVDVELGLPSLLWALYPRGVLGVVKANWLLKTLSAITKPLFLLISPVFKVWQKAVYSSVYKKAIRLYPHLKKEIKQGMTYPELLS